MNFKYVVDFQKKKPQISSKTCCQTFKCDVIAIRCHRYCRRMVSASALCHSLINIYNNKQTKDQTNRSPLPLRLNLKKSFTIFNPSVCLRFPIICQLLEFLVLKLKIYLEEIMATNKIHLHQLMVASPNRIDIEFSNGDDKLIFGFISFRLFYGLRRR